LQGGEGEKGRRGARRYWVGGYGSENCDYSGYSHSLDNATTNERIISYTVHDATNMYPARPTDADLHYEQHKCVGHITAHDNMEGDWQRLDLQRLL
jgi:hypothetical protein